MIQFHCPHCGRAIRTGPESVGRMGTCLNCQQTVQVPVVSTATLSPAPEFTDSSSATIGDPNSPDSVRESVLCSFRPTMFRNSPVLFVLAWLLVPAGVGIPILLCWWLSIRGLVLTVTTSAVRLSHGVRSTHVSEIPHSDVQDVRISQTRVQRALGVGRVVISGSGNPETRIDVNGVPQPDYIKRLVEELR